MNRAAQRQQGSRCGRKEKVKEESRRVFSHNLLGWCISATSRKVRTSVARQRGGGEAQAGRGALQWHPGKGAVFGERFRSGRDGAAKRILPFRSGRCCFQKGKEKVPKMKGGKLGDTKGERKMDNLVRKVA